MAHTIEGKRVRVSGSTTHGKFGTRPHNFTLDFSGCTTEEILGLATKTVVIDIQRMIRSAGSIEGIESFNNREYDVADLIRNRRTGKTALERAEMQLAKLSPEELQALLQKAQAKAKQGK